MLLRAMVQNLEIEDDKIKYKTLENQFINLYTISEKAEEESLPRACLAPAAPDRQ